MYKLFFLAIISFLTFISNSWGKDLSLNSAIEMAINNNFKIKEAEEFQNAAIEGSKSAFTDLFAKAYANYSYTALKDEPFQKIMGTARPVSDKNVYHWDIMLIQPIFKGFSLSSNYNISKIAVKIKEFEKKQIISDIVQEVKIVYFETLLKKRIESVADDTVSSLKSHENNAQNFYKQGAIPYNDLLKSKVALANAIQEREKAKAELKLSLSRLNIVIGKDINDDTTIEDINKVDIKSYNLLELTKEALEKRPVLETLRLGIQNLDNSVKMAQSSYYPEIMLTCKYEQNGNDMGANTNDYSNAQNSSVSILSKWMFFEWGKTRAEVAKQKFNKTAFMEKIKSAEDQIKLETKGAYLDVIVSENNMKTAKEAMEQAQESFRITNLQYLQRVNTSTEVLDARTFLSQAETNYYKSLYGYMIAVGRLERAIGRYK
ncbi:MAG: TolC family protein [Desulfobacterales bacterium]|nr:TolC family protein [Desulfobacterales bacterium]MBF0397669.1 TolC family protein [Desulfobacterales bacterium]